MDNIEEAKRHILKSLQILQKLENVPGILCAHIGEVQIRLNRSFHLLATKEELEEIKKVKIEIK